MGPMNDQENGSLQAQNFNAAPLDLQESVAPPVTSDALNPEKEV